MFGSLVACPISNRVGRKRALMLSGVPALIGWLMIALAHLASSHVQAFYGVLLTGRMLTGFSSGWSVFCVSVSYCGCLICMYVEHSDIIFHINFGNDHKYNLI